MSEPYTKSAGLIFNDWYKENQDDINGDKNIDASDIRLWLKRRKRVTVRFIATG